MIDCGDDIHYVNMYVCICHFDIDLEPRDLEDPEHKELAQRLPDTTLHSRADSTVRKYLGAFKRWKSWASERQIAPMPAKDHHVALYIQFLADSTKSRSAIEEACNSIAWVHLMAGLSSPQCHHL